MARIILDISANTHKNNYDYYIKMIDELAKVNTGKHEVILKWQLFQNEGENTVPDKELFVTMKEWAWKTYKLQTTASVFDIPSLKFLLQFDDLPFVKIANRHTLYYLAEYVPRRLPVYISRSSVGYDIQNNIIYLFCVSKYPASIEDYPMYVKQLSDHTVGTELFKRNNAMIWEKHYRLPDSTGLDAGEFAITPQELRTIL